MIMVWGIDIQYQPHWLEQDEEIKSQWIRSYNPEYDPPCIAKALLGLYQVVYGSKNKYPRYKEVNYIREILNTPYECQSSATIWENILVGRMKVSLSEPYLDQHAGVALSQYVSELYIPSPPVINGVWHNALVSKADIIQMFPECKDMPFNIHYDYLRERC